MDLRAETPVHICYGYGIEANNKWKETLGAEWRQYEQSFPLLQQSSIDIVSLERIHSHVPREQTPPRRGNDTAQIRPTRNITTQRDPPSRR